MKLYFIMLNQPLNCRVSQVHQDHTNLKMKHFGDLLYFEMVQYIQHFLLRILNKTNQMTFILGVDSKILDTRRPIRMKLLGI